MSLKVKNIIQGMNSPNSVNVISVCNNGINKDHINVDELEIDTKTKKGKNYNFVKKIIIKLFSKGE